MESDSEYGRLFEHFFIYELMRLNGYKRGDIQFSFYRTERGAEVDIIIELPIGKIIAIEVKSTANPFSFHISGLRSFREKVDIAELLLAC